MGNVVIITGMSGVKPKRVLKKFNVFLGKQGKQPISVVDLEELLIEEARNDPVCKASPDFMKSLEDQEPIIAVTSLPYPMLNRLWGQAVEKAEEKIEEEKKKDRNVALVLHAVYFKAKSTEFVPIVDAEKLRPLNPKYIVHLVDDIYDVYAWLRCEGGIFDEYTYPGGESKQVKKSIQYLVSTLVWRQAEAGASAHLAGLLGGVPVLTIATKHRCGLLKQVFEEKEILPVYVSHPISEARRVAGEGNKKLFEDWSNLVNSLADHLSVELAIWEPSTIDEWRIQHIKVKTPVGVIGEQEGDRKGQFAIEKNNSRRLKLYLPRLLERWPFGRVDEVLWSEPEEPLREPLDPADFFTDEEIDAIRVANTWEEIKDKLGEKKSLELCCISGELEVLAAIIGEQINSRDRTLIRQCPNLVICRPLFNGNSAGGVLSELKAHKGFTELKHYKDKPRVFVLENSNDEKLLWRNTVVELLSGDERPWWRSYVSDAKGKPISREKSVEIGDFVTKDELTATGIVEKMGKATKELDFRWGKEPELLNGLGKGRARTAFCKQRVTELETAFTQQTEYQRVLAEYDDSMVYREKDIDVTAFAKKVIDILKEE